MEKLMYLVQLAPGTTPEAARTAMIDDVGTKLLDAGALGLTIDVADEAAQFTPLAPPPADDPLHAVVSLWLDAYDYREPFEAILRDRAAKLAGYQVVESMYREYGGNQWSGPREWPDGQRSPGPLVVTMFPQHPDMDFDTWIRYWHDKQSPMSEAIQPRTRYVRNAVFRAITADAPPFRAIVEEAWPSIDAVTDPMQFFCADGDSDTLTKNITTMMEHVGTFIPMDQMRNYPMSEWILKTL
ncbi:MAG TPA: hypothetical protein VGO03_01525 [Acidimicrobiia bacterium]